MNISFCKIEKCSYRSSTVIHKCKTMLVVAIGDLGTEQMGLPGIGSFTHKNADGNQCEVRKMREIIVPYIFLPTGH